MDATTARMATADSTPVRRPGKLAFKQALREHTTQVKRSASDMTDSGCDQDTPCKTMLVLDHAVTSCRRKTTFSLSSPAMKSSRRNSRKTVNLGCAGETPRETREIQPMPWETHLLRRQQERTKHEAMAIKSSSIHSQRSTLPAVQKLSALHMGVSLAQPVVAQPAVSPVAGTIGADERALARQRMADCFVKLHAKLSSRTGGGSVSADASQRAAIKLEEAVWNHACKAASSGNVSDVYWSFLRVAMKNAVSSFSKNLPARQVKQPSVAQAPSSKRHCGSLNRTKPASAATFSTQPVTPLAGCAFDDVTNSPRPMHVA